MESVGQTLAVAFSGADLVRAIWLGLIASLFCNERNTPLAIACITFAIDRIWPFAAMGLSGHSVQSVSAAVAYAIRSIPSDFFVLAVRFFGIYGLIMLGYVFRLRIHGRRHVTKPAKVS